MASCKEPIVVSDFELLYLKHYFDFVEPVKSVTLFQV